MLLSLAVAATAAFAFLSPSTAAAADRNLLDVQVQGGIYVTQGTPPEVGNADVSQPVSGVLLIACMADLSVIMSLAAIANAVFDTLSLFLLCTNKRTGQPGGAAAVDLLWS